MDFGLVMNLLLWGHGSLNGRSLAFSQGCVLCRAAYSEGWLHVLYVNSVYCDIGNLEDIGVQSISQSSRCGFPSPHDREGWLELYLQSTIQK